MEMGVTLETRAEESREHRAGRLMKSIIANGAEAYGILDALYVELKVGGDFFRGRKMPPEVDELTRYELVGYITALAAVLLRCAPREAHEADSTVAHLETLVFLPEWQAARPAYRRYVDRFHHANPTDSAVRPRHKVLLILFRETVIDLWGVSRELLEQDAVVQRYCGAFTALHERVESRVLTEISGNANAGYGHLSPSL
jgi:hypothetical protein